MTLGRSNHFGILRYDVLKHLLGYSFRTPPKPSRYHQQLQLNFELN